MHICEWCVSTSKNIKTYLRVHTGISITFMMVYAFPCVFLSSHVRMCTCLRLRAILVCRPASRVYVSACMYVCTFPGEPVVGQRVSPNQGHIGGGDADDRQPLRFCLPPLLLSSTRLQRLQGPPTRGTTLSTHGSVYTYNTHMHKESRKMYCHVSAKMKFWLSSFLLLHKRSMYNA